MPNKLTSRQQAVMDKMLNGWTAVQTHGNAVSINGNHVCNIDTMTVLARRGLVRKINRWEWAINKGDGQADNTDMYLSRLTLER